MFLKETIKIENSFHKFKNSCDFSESGRGQTGAYLGKLELNKFPLVRGTNRNFPIIQPFQPIHYDLVHKIKNAYDAIKFEFNFAQVEIYDNTYCKMKYHSDLSLDLEKDSFIGLFSCYSLPNYNCRTLKIKEKSNGNITSINLNNNSVVLFSQQTNRLNLHKIMLSYQYKELSEACWLGITFRMSRTYITFINEQPYFSKTLKRLRLANKEEEILFFNEKNLENRHINHKFLEIDYTINANDLEKPIVTDLETKIKYNNIFFFEESENDIIHNNKFKELSNKFCGRVINNLSVFKNMLINNNDYLACYICGDIYKIFNLLGENSFADFYVIKEYSFDYNNYNINYRVLSIGEVPFNYHGVGILFKNFFPTFNKEEIFKQINDNHVFHELTESTKAFRTGLYISNVQRDINNKDVLNFNLLRCSTNFTNSTENFRSIDKIIIEKVQNKCYELFTRQFFLNHVLAQIYHNNKEDKKKAKIKAHSDKTKDMYKNGIIAFCSFYSDIENIKMTNHDEFDHEYMGSSVLSKLHFKLKKSIDYGNFEKEFSVTLYPNSVFLIPLSTNRLYTHEIRSAMPSIENLPTRMGYVIRCSNQTAIFKNDSTYLLSEDGDEKSLKRPTDEHLAEIKLLYLSENQTDKFPDYSNVNEFSLNEGDFLKPVI